MTAHLGCDCPTCSFEQLVCKLGLCPGDHCPFCKACLAGDPIPEESRAKGYYGNKTHFSRKISIYDREQDRTIRFQCPDCNISWIA